MANSKFKIGQAVSFPSSNTVGNSARKGGVITNIEKMYELKEKNKRYYPNGKCRGELTTIKELSKGKIKGYAYVCKTIQPQGFCSETVIVEDSHIGRKGAIASGGILCGVKDTSDVTYDKIKKYIEESDNEIKPKWQGGKMNVLIPMAGAGSRFEQAGYTFPKPLIDVD